MFGADCLMTKYSYLRYPSTIWISSDNQQIKQPGLAELEPTFGDLFFSLRAEITASACLGFGQSLAGGWQKLQNSSEPATGGR